MRASAVPTFCYGAGIGMPVNARSGVDIASQQRCAGQTENRGLIGCSSGGMQTRVPGSNDLASGIVLLTADPRLGWIVQLRPMVGDVSDSQSSTVAGNEERCVLMKCSVHLRRPVC
jgi:hypothetical protein